MVRSNYKMSFIVLPLTYFLVWLRGAIAFCSYNWLYAVPALFIFLVLIFITLWCYRLGRMLGLSNVGDVYLKSLLKFKLRIALLLFVSFVFVAELSPLIAYPFIFSIGVVVSLIGLSKSKKKDFIAIKNLLLNENSSDIDVACYCILSGGIITEHVLEDAQSMNTEQFNNTIDVNPATGLPMVGANKSIDVSGNPHGVNLGYRERDI